MKRTCAVLLPAFVLAATTIPNFSRAQNDGYAVTARGANYSILQKTTVENGTNRIHQYTELATGLNYTNSYGQLVESEEQIDILPNGGAAAVQGQHQVYFPADIADGVLEVVTPDGRHLQSRPLGVSYDDGSNTVFIATLTNAVGWLTASNQVTYRNCFSGIDADLVCTYRRSGFECDLVFRRQPPAPDQYGLDDSSSTLQLVTEFFNTQDPQEIPAAYDEWYGLQDDTLKFGKLTMKQGRAFAVGGSGSNSAQNSRSRFTSAATSSVYKRWLHLAGRTFLIEEVPLEYLADDLNTLPPETNALTSKVTGRLRMASNHLKMPPAQEFVSGTGKIQIAANGLNRQPGVVLDYDEIDTDQSDFTFQNGVTYYVSSYVNFYGTPTFEGGSVIKFDEQNGGFGIYSAVNNSTDPSNPTVFTSMNDDSVGEVIPGSSGEPAPLQCDPMDVFTNYIELKNFRFLSAEVAFDNYMDSSTNIFWNCEFSGCYESIDLQDGQVSLNNVLFDGCSKCAFFIGNNSYAQNLFVNHVTTSVGILALTLSDPGISYLCVTNSIIYGTLEYGEVYHMTTNHVVTNPSGIIFQTGGNANYYLATSSPYRDIGTTNIDPDLLAELQTMTTYAPQDGGWPDTNAPDLGYHYPVNEDSDYDGLPDWWEWKYFGTYDYSGTNQDGSGNSLLSYYQYSTDPSVVQFWLSMTNMYLNTNQTSVMINLQGGWPFYVAVLVNDTNQADAVWQTYTGTNIAVTLGTTDGDYNVWVGLRGWPTNAQPTWDTGDITFTLDRAPPAIVITNPVIASGTATFTRPYLQLQGYGSENLLSVSYDITNALGVATNLDGFVTDKFYDTNLLDFTTNFFQCYDVALTNGLNLITLRATDLAGNTTTTNILVTLDYSTATNPPIIQLIWPQDGMQVSGTNFYLRGQLNDETAAVTAQIVDTNGDTNVVEGIVERGGMFWVEDLPLTNGDNILTVTATDAAGNVATTNITVTQSSLTLTIDSTPTGDDLYKPFGSVSGTVSDPTATVTVNGVAASVDGGGNWSADSAPVYGRGTATFDAQASASGMAATVSSAKEMGPYVAIVQYHISKENRGYDSSGVNWLDVKDQKDYSAKVSVDAGGNWQRTYTGTLHDDYYYVADGHYITDLKWSDTNGGTYVEDDGFGDLTTNTVNGYTEFGNYGWQYDDLESVPDEDVGEDSYYFMYYVVHYFAKGVDWTRTDPNYEVKIDEAKTEVKLYTGGKAKIARQNLFGISVSAGGYGEPDFLWEDYPWHDAAGEPVDITSTTVLGQHPGSDHMVWIALPDSLSGVDMTVTAPTSKHYSASASPTKYKLQIVVNDTFPLWPDHVPSYNHYSVGQYLKFAPYWTPETPPYIADSSYFHWHLPGDFVNDHSQANSDSSDNYFINSDLLAHEITHCWYVDKLQAGTASVGMNLQFPNGQNASIAAVGQFSVFRPSVVMVTNAVHGTPIIQWLDQWNSAFHGRIGLGQIGGPNNLSYYIRVISPMFGGQAKITQLCNIDFSGLTLGFCTDGLDNEDPYPNTARAIATDPNPGGTLNRINLDDAPSAPGYYSVKLNGSFVDYIMFTPGGESDIYVPLGKVLWNTSAAASYPSLTISPNSVTGPSDPDGSLDWPIWTCIVHNPN